MKKSYLYSLPLSILILGCGGTSNTSSSDGEGSIDLRTYFEKEDITKNYQLNDKAVGQVLTNHFYTEVSVVTASSIERKIEGITDSIVNIEEKRLTNIDVSDEGNINTSYYRHVDMGDTIFSRDINSTQTLKVGSQEVGTQERLGSDSCKLEEVLNGFTQDSNTYTGDILKIKCTKKVTITTKVKDDFIGTVSYINGTEDSIDIYYSYYKKDIGLVTSINNDCIPTGVAFPDDTSVKCSNGEKSYSYIYYLGN